MDLRGKYCPGEDELDIYLQGGWKLAVPTSNPQRGQRVAVTIPVVPAGRGSFPIHLLAKPLTATVSSALPRKSWTSL